MGLLGIIYFFPERWKEGGTRNHAHQTQAGLASAVLEQPEVGLKPSWLAMVPSVIARPAFGRSNLHLCEKARLLRMSGSQRQTKRRRTLTDQGQPDCQSLRGPLLAEAISSYAISGDCFARAARNDGKEGRLAMPDRWVHTRLFLNGSLDVYGFANRPYSHALTRSAKYLPLSASSKIPRPPRDF